MSEPPHLTIAGTTAVVTGAAGGIGEALALMLAEAGADVALADINEEGLKRVAAEIEKRGQRAFWQKVNVADFAEVEAFASALFAWSDKPVAVVFANAGIHGMTDDIDPDLDVWNRVVAINIMGPVHMVKAFVGRLIAQQTPSQFVVTASQGSFVGFQGMAPYIASKHAEWGHIDCLRHALAAQGSHVGVSLVAPSRTASGITLPKVETLKETGGKDAAAAYAAQLTSPASIARVMIREAAKRAYWIVPSHEPIEGQVTQRIDELLAAIPAGRIEQE